MRIAFLLCLFIYYISFTIVPYLNDKINLVPSIKELNTEYEEILSQKRAAYAEYKQVKKDMQTYQVAKYDIDKILGIDGQQKETKDREKLR